MDVMLTCMSVYLFARYPYPLPTDGSETKQPIRTFPVLHCTKEELNSQGLNVLQSVVQRQPFQCQTYREQMRGVDMRHNAWLQIVTAEFWVDLDGGLRLGQPPVLCLWLTTALFQLKIRWAEVQSRFVCVCVCVITQLFFVVFCVDTAVHSFHLSCYKRNTWQTATSRKKVMQW